MICTLIGRKCSSMQSGVTQSLDNLTTLHTNLAASFIIIWSLRIWYMGKLAYRKLQKSTRDKTRPYTSFNLEFLSIYFDILEIFITFSIAFARTFRIWVIMVKCWSKIMPRSIYTMELSYVLRDLGVSCHFHSDDTQILLNIDTESQACEDFN